MPSNFLSIITDPVRTRHIQDALYASLVMGVAVAMMLFLLGSTDIMTSLTIIGILLCLSLVGSTLRFFSMARADADLSQSHQAMDVTLKTMQHRVGDHDLILLQMAGQIETIEGDIHTIKKTQTLTAQQHSIFMRGMKDKMMLLISALARARKNTADLSVTAATPMTAAATPPRKKSAPKNFFTPPAMTANDFPAPAPHATDLVPQSEPHFDDDIHVSPALIGEALQTAITQQRIDTYVQPIATLPQRRAFGYAVSGRIRLQPGVYIPARQYRGVASHLGLQVAIDRLVLSSIAPLIPLLRAERMFVNITAEGLRDTETIAVITRLMNRATDGRRRLVLEVSQRDFARLDSAAEQVIAALQKIGVQFGVNDVAAQEMDLNKLARLNFSYLKLSYQTVITTKLSDAGAAVLHRFVTRLQTRNIQLIVGGVEGADDVRPLLDYPITLAQGYAFGRPDRPVAYQQKPKVA